MSKFLIAVGSLIIAILLTALIGPFFVDWTSYRESFEREASAYIGRPVNISGKAGVRLLPTPVVSFTNIRIGEIDDPDMDVERFRAEVELAPLLKGEVRIIQMAVERPRFRIDIAALGEGRGVFGNAWRIDPERISLARLEVREGSADIADSRTGRTWQADGINGIVEADSLRGPGSVEGTLTLEDRFLSFRAAFGRVAGDALPANVSLTSPQFPVTLAAEGMLRFPQGSLPNFEGAAVLEGADDAAETGSPWREFRASGPVALSLDGLAVDRMQISYGGAERPLIVETSGRVDFSSEPRFDVAVAARQIDVDRTLGFGGEAPVAIGQALAGLLQHLPAIEVPPIPGTARLDAQGVLVGGSLISQVEADLATAGDAWLVRGLSGVLPGETSVAVRGEFKVGEEPSFRGKGSIASKRPAALATWWKGSVGSAARLGAFTVEADLDLARDRQAFSNLAIATPAGITAGSFELRRFEDPQGLFLTVDLSADRADALELRALGELLAAPGASLSEIRQMTVSLQAGTLTADNVEAHAVLIEGGYEDGRLDLRRLSVADLQGASINATGHIDDPLGARSGRIDASVDAQDITGAANFLSRLLPDNPVAARLVAAAPSLSPMRAEFSAETGSEAGSLVIDLTGSFAETHVSLQSVGKGDLGNPAAFEGSTRLHVDGEDAAVVLVQLGFAPLSVRSGLLRLDADFEGRLASGKLKVSGTVAGIDVGYAGDAAIEEGRLALSGSVEASTQDIDPALLLAGVAVPGIGEGHAASAAGTIKLEKDRAELMLTKASFAEQPVAGSVAADWDSSLDISGSLDVQAASLPFIAALAAGYSPDMEGGVWSDRPFASPLPRDLSLDIALDIAELDLGGPVAAADARMAISLDGGALELDLDEATFAGGTLKGTLAAKLAEGEMAASLSAALTGAQLQALVGEQAGLPVASGALDLSVEASGNGRSMAGIIATLSGSGSFTVNDGRLNALDPMALRDVMRAAEGESEPDETVARETFASRFDSGAFSFGRAAGSFQLASGVVKVSKVSLEGEAATVLADATLDLGAMSIASDWTVRVEPEGEEKTQPHVTLTYSGPVADPERRVNLNPLLDQLRSRFLQRQLEEIERLEEERRRADAAAAALVAKAAEEASAVSTGSVSTDPVAVPGSTVAPEVLPAVGAVPDPPAALSETAPATSASGTLRDSDLLLEPAPADPAPDFGAAAPELDSGAEAFGPPLSLIPQPEPPPPAAPERRRRAARPAAAPAPQPAEPPAAPPAEFKTLPNGVVVKIR